jgi:hypothetical protein
VVVAIFSFFLLCWFLIRFAGTPQKCPKSAKCGEDWHVCTKHEQKGGALQAARANGMYSGQEGKWVEYFWSVASSLLVLGTCLTLFRFRVSWYQVPKQSGTINAIPVVMLGLVL